MLKFLGIRNAGAIILSEFNWMEGLRGMEARFLEFKEGAGMMACLRNYECKLETFSGRFKILPHGNG